MNKIRKVWLIILFLLSSTSIYAYDFVVDGICYNKLPKGQVEVTSGYGYSGRINIPESIKYIGFTYKVTAIGECAFNCCNNLNSVTIPNSVISIGDWAFNQCYNLTSVTIPSSVTSIGNNVFQLCASLSTIIIPQSVTSIGDGAFDCCGGLNAISVEDGNMYYDSRDNCNAVIETASNTLIAGSNSTIIPNSVTSIGDYAFSYRNGLAQIEIPNSITTIGSYAFYYCESLSTVTFLSGLASIGDSAFRNCKALTSISLPNSVISIGQSAFQECFGLISVTIPMSVENIGNSAFAFCSGLTYVTSKIVNPFTIDLSVFSSVSSYHDVLQVPQGSKSKYEAYSGWTKYFREIVEEGSGATATYSLSIAALGYGSVSYNNSSIRNQSQSFSLNEGSSATIIFSPDNGYRIGSLTVNGVDVTSSIANNQYIIDNITTNTTLSVTFEAIPEVINLSLSNYPSYTFTYDLTNPLTLTSTWSQFSQFILQDGLGGMSSSVFDDSFVADCKEGGTVNSNDVAYVSANAQLVTQGSVRGYRLKLYNFGSDIYGNGGTPPLRGAYPEETRNTFEQKELGTAIYYPHGEGTAKHAFSWTLSKEELDYLTANRQNNDPVTITRWICFTAKGNASYANIWVKMTMQVTRKAAANTFNPVSIEPAPGTMGELPQEIRLTFANYAKIGTGFVTFKRQDGNVSFVGTIDIDPTDKKTVIIKHNVGKIVEASTWSVEIPEKIFHNDFPEDDYDYKWNEAMTLTYVVDGSQNTSATFSETLSNVSYLNPNVINTTRVVYKDIVLNDLIVYAYKYDVSGLVPGTGKVKVLYDLGTTALEGKLVAYPNIAEELGSYGGTDFSEVYALKFVPDQPVQAGDLDNYPGLYRFFFEKAAFGDANYGKWLADPNSVAAADCIVNPEMSGPTFQIDNVRGYDPSAPNPPTTYTLSISASGNGSATYNSTTIRNTTRSYTVNEGTSATITFSPSSGYRIASVRVNNTDVTSSVSNNQYTLSNIAANITLSVKFEAIPATTYSLSISASGNGSATYDGTTIRGTTRSFTLNESSSATVSFAPDSGHRIASVMVNNTDVTSSIANNQYTISNITANTTLNVAFEAIPATTYSLDITASGNGSATYDGTTVRGTTRSFTLNEGSSATVSFAPDSGHRIASVMVNNTDVTSSVSNNQYTISNIKANTTLSVTFEAIPATTYSLSITASGNGSATYDGTTVKNETRAFTVEEGTSATVSFSPDNGNSVSRVKLNGADVTGQVSGNRYTISNITANTTMEVVFVEDVNALTVDGINYTVTSQAAKTVKVSGCSTGLVLTVPATVTQNGTTWTVTGIDTDALKNNKELAAVIWNPSAAFTATVSNPNLLLYVKQEQYAPAVIRNVVVNGTAASVTLTEAANGNSFYCPQAFTAQKVSYTHKYGMTTGIGESRGWETLALPFDVQTITHETKGAIVPFANWKSGDTSKPFWLYELAGTGFVEASSIKAYTPYIVSMPNNQAYDNEWQLKGGVIFAANSVTIGKTENMHTASYQGRTLVPNFTDRDAHEGLYALNVVNDYCTNNSGMTEGSKFVLNMRQIHPFEAYYVAENSNAAPYAFGIFEDMVTDIREIYRLPISAHGIVYDLQGRKLEAPVKKGIYIQNGKKLIIK